MNLKDTVNMMLSNDYKERFKAEYVQTVVRADRLETFLRKYREGKLEITPDCPYEVLFEQFVYMTRYIQMLEERAELEDIPLPGVQDEKGA